MGEVSDSIVNGEICQACGDWIGGGDGYPRNCSRCGPSEHEADRNQFKRDRERQFAADFPECEAIADANGLTLQRHSDVHYSLSEFGDDGRRRWMKHIYPTKRRIWSKDRSGPYIDGLPENWTLIDVVNGAIRAVENLKKSNATAGA